MSGILKGTLFEVQVSSALRGVEGISVLSGMNTYSGYLQRETQIDMLIFTAWKLYCVEIKSFMSELRGQFEERTWSGRTYGKTTMIYSPVFQNFEHIRSLNNNLRSRGLKTYDWENVVVVPDGCVINHDTNIVCTLSQFIDRLRSESYMESKYQVGNILQDMSLVTAV